MLQSLSPNAGGNIGIALLIDLGASKGRDQSQPDLCPCVTRVRAGNASCWLLIPSKFGERLQSGMTEMHGSTSKDYAHLQGGPDAVLVDFTRIKTHMPKTWDDRAFRSALGMQMILPSWILVWKGLWS